jgi:hypothetical protein
LRLLLERAIDFAVHPRTGERRLGGAEQHLAYGEDYRDSAVHACSVGQSQSK